MREDTDYISGLVLSYSTVYYVMVTISYYIINRCIHDKDVDVKI